MSRRSLTLLFSPRTRLERELTTIARSYQSVRMHETGAVIWSVAAGLIGGFLGLHFIVEGLSSWIGPAFLLSIAGGAGVQIWFVLRTRLDVLAAARRIEADNPELDAMLRTAVEQHSKADGELNFMQERLLKEAVDRVTQSVWHLAPRQHSRWMAAAHGTAILAALVIGITGLKFATFSPWSWDRLFPEAAWASSGIEITPGSVEIEKGTTVVVAARFNESMPISTVLHWRQADGASGQSAMARSLSDPVFAFTLPEVSSDTVYHVEHDGSRTPDFSLTVFELPDLVRADAALNYPDYTGLPDRSFIDTRRISAVAGAELDYEFLVNRSLERATLISTDGDTLDLTPRNDERTRFGLSIILTESRHWRLELADAEGRTDPDPTDIRIAVQPNIRPEITLEFPRSDQRVSPLEELDLQGRIKDDFGLIDFGLAYSIGAAEPVFQSFATEGTPVVESRIDYQLALESHAVEVDELITWFGWADDFGPDGQTRRTTGDLFFAEVRALDEIFRESEGGSPPPGGGGGGPAGDLLEIQRQISVAIWNLRKSDTPPPTYVDDVDTLVIGQEQALGMLEELRQNIEDSTLIEAADRAAEAMEDTTDHLSDAQIEESLEPLPDAWADAQLAFRALLKLQPRETQVAQGQPGSGGGGGGRNQDQLNQLRFRQESDNYATQSEAQPPASPEEREQLNVLARLKELARRQDDLNERLQELQTALAAAADDAEREEIRRELKRLEEEQRRMLAELDETRQRVDNMPAGDQRREASQQLEQTREDMQEAGEQLEEGNVSQSLASGTRARESLEQTGENLREDSSNIFSEEMRELRRQARELAEQQEALQEQWDETREGPPSLDSGNNHDELAEAVQEQRERYENLMDRLRQASADAESAEPVLHRRLYDVLREQGIGGTDQQLRAAGELLRRGFVDEARRQQSGVGPALDRLREGVERAADAVLGDEGAELRFAQNELNDLVRQLRDESAARNGGQNGEEDGTSPGPGPPDESGLDLAMGPDEGPGSGEDSDSGEPGSASRATGEGEPGTELAAGRGENSREGSPPGETPGTEPGSSPSSDGPTEGTEPATGSTPSESGVAQSGSPGSATPRESNPEPGEGPPSPSSLLDQLAEALGTSSGGGGEGTRNGTPAGPLTGDNFADWADRLRTIESLMDDPELRQQLGEARGQAEELRRGWQRQGSEPQWDLVDSGIVGPLEDARAWLQQELARQEDPETLQPIDRDPVPEKYADSVRKYYEALSAAESARTEPRDTPRAAE